MPMPFPFLADARDARDADQLRLAFGVRAGAEAAARADHARDLGNHLHYCRWRQVGRLVAWFEAEPEAGTLH